MRIDTYILVSSASVEPEYFDTKDEALTAATNLYTESDEDFDVEVFACQTIGHWHWTEATKTRYEFSS
jgi:hypothetical protein